LVHHWRDQKTKLFVCALQMLRMRANLVNRTWPAAVQLRAAALTAKILLLQVHTRRQGTERRHAQPTTTTMRARVCLQVLRELLYRRRISVALFQSIITKSMWRRNNNSRSTNTSSLLIRSSESLSQKRSR
jgi:hypothetical protein